MKAKLINIEYSDKYKALAVNAMPQEIVVDIPDNVTENMIHTYVFAAIARQHSPYLAENIEKAEIEPMM